MDNRNNPDDARELIHRELNKKKKQDIKEQYDMTVFEDSDLPAHVEGQFLDYITEFERQWESAKQLPLRDFVGNPSPPPLAALSPTEVSRELTKILDTFAEHNVNVDFLTDVTEAEAYRFITEELLDEEVDDIRIPGMNLNFIYEEFYPELNELG